MVYGRVRSAPGLRCPGRCRVWKPPLAARCAAREPSKTRKRHFRGTGPEIKMLVFDDQSLDMYENKRKYDIMSTLKSDIYGRLGPNWRTFWSIENAPNGQKRLAEDELARHCTFEPAECFCARPASALRCGAVPSLGEPAALNSH